MPINLNEIPKLQKIIVSEEITLRPLEEADSKYILDVLARDNSIRDRVTVASRMHTEQDVKDEIQRYKNDDGLIRYAIINNNRVIGLVSLWRDTGYFGTSPNNDDYGFGYFLDSDYRGKGIISDSLTALITVSRNTLEVRQFVAFCELDNKPSVKVLTKLGFAQTDESFSEPENGWTEYKFVKR